MKKIESLGFNKLQAHRFQTLAENKDVVEQVNHLQKIDVGDTLVSMVKETKKRVIITIDREKLKQLKKMAIDKETSLSNLLVSACDTELMSYNAGSKKLS